MLFQNYLMHGSILAVTTPCQAHPPGICIFYIIKLHIPHPQAYRICMFWPVEMKQLQNISVDVNFMPPDY